MRCAGPPPCHSELTPHTRATDSPAPEPNALSATAHMCSYCTSVSPSRVAASCLLSTSFSTRSRSFVRPGVQVRLDLLLRLSLHSLSAAPRERSDSRSTRNTHKPSTLSRSQLRTTTFPNRPGIRPRRIALGLKRALSTAVFGVPLIPTSTPITGHVQSPPSQERTARAVQQPPQGTAPRADPCPLHAAPRKPSAALRPLQAQEAHQPGTPARLLPVVQDADAPRQTAARTANEDPA